jgi:hypothetical protein
MALVYIFKSFGTSMDIPEVTKCHDGLFRRVLYSLAAYIADYPEQVLLTCIVQGWCPKYVLLSFSKQARTNLLRDHRCMADHEDLDGVGEARSQSHREQVLEDHALDDVWDMFGIVGDLKVCSVTVKRSYYAHLTTVQPFTDYFPRADIYVMIAFDILHQLIKGTFKDHLITWVEDYLKEEHGEAGYATVMDDIDLR